MNITLLHLNAISIDLIDLAAGVIILFVVAAVIGLIVTAARRTQSIKRADAFTNKKVKEALRTAADPKQIVPPTDKDPENEPKEIR